MLNFMVVLWRGRSQLLVQGGDAGSAASPVAGVVPTFSDDEAESIQDRILRAFVATRAHREGLVSPTLDTSTLVRRSLLDKVIASPTMCSLTPEAC